MVEQEYGCAYCHNDGAHDEIDGSVVEDVHSGSALTAGIAAAFHSGRQLIGTAERGDEQGDQNRDECLCPRAFCASMIFSVSSIRVGINRSAMDIIMENS